MTVYLGGRYYIIKLLTKNMKSSDKKKKIIISLKKAHSSLAKVIGMVEKDCYCIEVMQQNLAVIGLLRSAHEALMENHLNTCFKSAMASKDERKKKKMTEEILKVTNLYNK
jgi:CsoR family transcriptional regulator, copper-sensing transcriptional repressor